MPVQFAAAEPPGLAVSVAELKISQRIDHADEDGLLADLIAAAVSLVEARTRRLLVRRAAVLTLPGFPASGEPILLRGGVVAAQPVVTWRLAGVVTTIDAGEMEFAGDCWPPRLAMADGAGWPTPDAFGWPVTVSYEAGYAPDGLDLGANVPAALRRAVCLLAGEMYARREEATVGVSVSRNVVAADALTAPFVVDWIG